MSEKGVKGGVYSPESVHTLADCRPSVYGVALESRIAFVSVRTTAHVARNALTRIVVEARTR